MAPDLVQRHVNPQAPNALWAGDNTYLTTHEGRLYLAAVIDFWSPARRWAGACSRRCTPEPGQGCAGHGLVAPAPPPDNHRQLHLTLGCLSPMSYEQRWYEPHRKKTAQPVS